MNEDWSKKSRKELEAMLAHGSVGSPAWIGASAELNRRPKPHWTAYLSLVVSVIAVALSSPAWMPSSQNSESDGIIQKAQRPSLPAINKAAESVIYPKIFSGQASTYFVSAIEISKLEVGQPYTQKYKEYSEERAMFPCRVSYFTIRPDQTKSDSLSHEDIILYQDEFGEWVGLKLQ